MKLLFIVTSYWAYGELTIALQFAKSLSKDNEIVFMVPRNQERIVKDSGFRDIGLYFQLPSINRALLLDAARTFSPDFVILSDYLNYSFCFKHYGLKLEDLDCFSGRIGAFDLYDIGKQDRTMDTYGFNNKRVIFDHDRVTFRLLPCPILSPEINLPSEDAYAVALNAKLHIRTKEEQHNAKEKLGFSPGKKLILTTSAVWQETYKAYDNVVEFVRCSEEAYQEIIAPFVNTNDVVCIGHNISKQEGVTYLDSLPPEVFRSYCEAADLFISRNMISTSFANIIMSGVKGLLLQSSRRDSKTIYPCRMHPVGWYDFLEPIVKDNAYMDLFDTGEIFSIDETREVLSKILNKDLDIQRLDSYHMQLKALTSGDLILKDLMSKRL